MTSIFCWCFQSRKEGFEHDEEEDEDGLNHSGEKRRHVPLLQGGDDEEEMRRRRRPNEGRNEEDTNARLAKAVGVEDAYLRPTTCEGHPDDALVRTGTCTHTFNDVYLVKEQIGKGSTSTCYKCVHRRSGNVLAVKVIDKRRVAMMFSELLAQFRQEVHILRLLNHPHIIKLYEVFESDTTLHVVTEFVQNGELFDYLVERPERLLSEAEASGIIKQVGGVSHLFFFLSHDANRR